MAIANCDYAGRAIHGHVVKRLVARPTVRRLGVPRSWQTAAATIATKTIVREPLQAGSLAAASCVVIVLVLVRFNVVQHLHGTLVRHRQRQWRRR